jgi:hypothetical protein
MKQNDLENVSISLIQIGQTLQDNRQAIYNAINAANILENIQNELRNLTDGQRAIRNDINRLTDGQRAIRNDINRLTDGQVLIRNDINRLRYSLGGLRQDFNNFRGVMRRRLENIDNSSVTRAYNSHQISTEAIIRWIPVNYLSFFITFLILVFFKINFLIRMAFVRMVSRKQF